MLHFAEGRELEFLGHYKYQDGENGPSKPIIIPDCFTSKELNEIAGELKRMGSSRALIDRGENEYLLTIETGGGWKLATRSKWKFL